MSQNVTNHVHKTKTAKKKEKKRVKRTNQARRRERRRGWWRQGREREHEDHAHLFHRRW